MSLLEQQKFLASLYTNPSLRNRFILTPEITGREFGLNDNEINDLVAIAWDEIQFFSESLVWKRLREAEKMLPMTSRALEDGFEKAFFEFAPSYLPKNIKKHYEDAVEFCKFVENARGLSGCARNAAVFERTRLIFMNERRILSWCFLRRGLGNTETGVRSKRSRLAIWLRAGKRVLHFTI